MKLHRFSDAREFYQRVGEYLLEHETIDTNLLGISQTLIHSPERYPEPAYLASVEADRKTVAVALRTPPHPLLLSPVADMAALNLIADDLYGSQHPLAEVNALAAVADAFAEIWQQLTGQSYKLFATLRSHALTTVQPISRASGYLRPATTSDLDLLIAWQTNFMLEAFQQAANPNEVERWVTYSLKQGQIYLWQDEVPVSFGSGRSVTDRSSRIGPVYTPSEYRKRGYASSCVAALSQHLLDQGHQTCFLFTDLDNPTSNKIYQAIGYQAIADWKHYRFSKK